MDWSGVGVIVGSGLCGQGCRHWQGSDRIEKAIVELNITKIKAYQGGGCQETHMGWSMAHTRL